MHMIMTRLSQTTNNNKNKNKNKNKKKKKNNIIIIQNFKWL